ncbi:helix-turn-helix domain-containing protein [Streptomyces sp. DSM 15324]|uniref:helix-turn-helix domain-containing protein n=1 Tax=Streptomyces sp. DSM 15324 TaxID=1739111 RepID=UPI00099E204C|nr:helix-turn-helix transcriptional regulator [Streptomyces sp. DSM 15324]
MDQLTKREREVLLLLADGLTNQGLANRLGIAQRTVRAHIFSIVRKLELQSRTEAALVGDRNRVRLASDTTFPEASPLDAAMPEVAMPDVVMPDVVMPEVAMPDVVMPDAVMP